MELLVAKDTLAQSQAQALLTSPLSCTATHTSKTTIASAKEAKEDENNKLATKPPTKVKVTRARTDPPDSPVTKPPPKKPKPAEGGSKGGSKELERSSSAGFNQMVIRGGKNTSAPEVGAIIQVKLAHDDEGFHWYKGTVTKTRQEAVGGLSPVTLFKILFDADGDHVWINLISTV